MAKGARKKSTPVCEQTRGRVKESRRCFLVVAGVRLPAVCRVQPRSRLCSVVRYVGELCARQAESLQTARACRVLSEELGEKAATNEDMGGGGVPS